MIAKDGYAVYEPTPEALKWAQAAKQVAERVSAKPDVRATNLRHGETWFVGVDVLPNASDGTLCGVSLAGSWQPDVPVLPMHPAQVSIVYPGYPGQDAKESDAAHRYRHARHAAHVDGLLPEGPRRRRFAREYHAYILGLPLTHSVDAPTVVWPGSHKIMQAALQDAIADDDPADVDVTDVYHDARRAVFDNCDPVPLTVKPGGAFLLHRFALHGTAAWDGPVGPARMIAFLRPEFPTADRWLASD